jgi:hypothetical protein
MKKITPFVRGHMARRFPYIQKYEFRKDMHNNVPKYYMLVYLFYYDCDNRVVRWHVQDFLKNYFLINVKVHVNYIEDVSEYDYDVYYDDVYGNGRYYEEDYAEEVIDLRGRRFPI